MVIPKHTAQKIASSKVRILSRTLLLAGVFALSLAIVACASSTSSTQIPTPISAPELSTDSPDDSPESRAAKALGSIPLEFSGKVIELLITPSPAL